MSTVKKVLYPKDYPSDEPMRRCPSIMEFKSEFKFRPKIGLNKGLKFFSEYAKKNFIRSKNFKNTTLVNLKATIKESLKFPVYFDGPIRCLYSIVFVLFLFLSHKIN